MLAPITPADVAADKALLSPAAWHGGERSQFLIAMSPWWMTADDVNDSDLDLVEYDNKDPALGPLGPTVVMYYCWCAEPATTNSARAPHPHRALCEHSARLAVEGSHALRGLHGSQGVTAFQQRPWARDRTGHAQ